MRGRVNSRKLSTSTPLLNPSKASKISKVPTSTSPAYEISPLELTASNSQPTAKSTISLSLRGIFDTLTAGFFESIVRDL
ncbi:hypothetical protein TrLO_g11990 [Triparma laevis f. longispina]|uniref:Uncharacterized protein n=1 Tax=Triparma laevis f. longispina TaxID=1714387 RepID=A0A9W7CKJ3_9STRA|nr:hypothetical protein TrLO_g11990 [Triparma laevis f. longispina]